MNDPKYRVITDGDKLKHLEPENLFLPIVAEIDTKYIETLDDFIFRMVGPYCKEITQRSISKHDLENALTQYFKGVWISVKDRLPDNDDKVLCCTRTAKGIQNIIIGYYMDGMWRCGMNNNVTHWMPLPEPPKGE